MIASIWPHRVLPPQVQQGELVARNDAMILGTGPAFVLRRPRGQRVPLAQRLLNQEMAQAQGRSRKRR